MTASAPLFVGIPSAKISSPREASMIDGVASIQAVRKVSVLAG
jgi:hypothetical protein